MAHKSIWYQGVTPYVVPKCDGKIPQTCPQSKRVAGEYARGFYTLTNVVNPNIFYDDYGVELPIKKELRELGVGDILWFILVPPKHKLIDVFAYNETTYTEHSSLQTFAGISLSLVTGTFTGVDENGDCPMTNETNHGTLVFPDSDDATEQFLVADVNTVNGISTYTGVGLKIDALPDGVTLADIVGKLAVGGHVLDYDAQTFM